MSGAEQDQGLLTEAEEAVVAARLEGSDRSRDDVVAEVKAERVGPAAQWEDTPEVDAPVADGIETLREALDQASQRRIAAAGNASDPALNEASRLKSNLEEINAYLVADAEQEAQAATGESDGGGSSSTEVDDESTASDIVAHLRENPGDADTIEEAELAREKGPRKTVLDAIESARAKGDES